MPKTREQRQDILKRIFLKTIFVLYSLFKFIISLKCEKIGQKKVRNWNCVVNCSKLNCDHRVNDSD